MSSSIEPQDLPLSRPLRAPLIWLLAIGAIPLLGVAIVAIALRARIAMAAAAHPFPLLTLAAPLLLMAVIALLAIKMHHAGVQIEGDSLVVNTGIGSKRVLLENLRAQGLRIVDLRERTELRPLLKLWATGVPGFSGGWFRLRNGEKAVCLLLDRHRVCYLRSDTDSLSLLLSLQNPEKLRALLERR